MDEYATIINLSNLEKDTNKLKIDFNGSTDISHHMNIDDDKNVVIVLYQSDNFMGNTYIFYGRLIDENIYIIHNEYLNGYPYELLKMNDLELIEKFK